MNYIYEVECAKYDDNGFIGFVSHMFFADKETAERHAETMNSLYTDSHPVLRYFEVRRHLLHGKDS